MLLPGRLEEGADALLSSLSKRKKLQIKKKICKSLFSRNLGKKIYFINTF